MSEPATEFEIGADQLSYESWVHSDQGEQSTGTELDYGKLLGLLVIGAENTATVGRRTVLLAYLFKADGAPRSLSDLGRVMGISKQAAAKGLTRFRRFLPEIAREIGFEG